MLKLWKISQDVNHDWDTFDSAVVAAETEDEARNTSPAGADWRRAWAPPEKVTVEYIGIAAEGIKPGVIVSSFNAG